MEQLRTQLLLRSDTSLNWSREVLVEGSTSEYQAIGAYAVLGKGEVGIEFLADGSKKVKIGDGITPWKDLAYFNDYVIPTKVSDLTNDANFQNDNQVAVAISTALADYYNKTSIDALETELKNAISAIPKFAIEVASANEDGKPNVSEPSYTTVYLVPDNDTKTADVYNEWIFVKVGEDSTWELLGKQTLDLSGYALTTYVDAEVKKVADDVDTLETVHSELATVVGDNEKGLVKDVAELKAVDHAGMISAAKQEAINAAAAAVPVKTVDTNVFGLTDGALTLKEISQAKVAGLETALSEITTNVGANAAAIVEINTSLADRYTKEETLEKIAEKITEINGGESAGEVLGQLNSYKEINDAALAALTNRVTAIDKADGALAGINTRLSNIETSVANMTLDVSRLTQAEGTYLILDGGDSSSFA